MTAGLRGSNIRKYGPNWTGLDWTEGLKDQRVNVLTRLSGGPSTLQVIQKSSFERRQHFYIMLQMNCSVNYHFKDFLTAIPFPLDRCSVLSKRASSKSVSG